MAQDEIPEALDRVAEYALGAGQPGAVDLTGVFARLYLNQFDEVLSDLSELHEPSKMQLALIEGGLSRLAKVVGGDLGALRNAIRTRLNSPPAMVAVVAAPRKPRVKRDVSEHFHWIALLAVASLFALGCWWLVRNSDAELSVDLEWEMGSMIQGICVGFAAVLASLTYWYRSRGQAGPPGVEGGNLP